MSVLDSIVKAYDIRGTVPDQLDADVAHALGVGFAAFVRSDRVVIGRDMRPSGPELVDAFTRGVIEQGIDVVDIGLASTDLMYYAAGVLDVPGAMFTASHNPAGYNGVKLCLAGARPIGVDTGLADVQAVAQQVLDGGGPRHAVTCGSRSERDLLSDFADHVVSFIDPADIGPMKVVADTANGMGGLVVPAVFERLDGVELDVMYAELDGTFPNHPADPCSPRTSATFAPGSCPVASISGSPSTAMPTGCSSSTRPATVSAARRPRQSSRRRPCVSIRAPPSSTT